MKLLKTLHLSPNDIIPAPGNHDINLKIAAATAVPSGHIKADELLDLDLLESLSVPFKGFEDFCKKMRIPPLNLGSKSSYLAGSRVHKGITWLVLNSGWFCGEGIKEKLHIGLPPPGCDNRHGIVGKKRDRPREDTILSAITREFLSRFLKKTKISIRIRLKCK